MLLVDTLGKPREALSGQRGVGVGGGVVIDDGGGSRPSAIMTRDASTHKKDASPSSQLAGGGCCALSSRCRFCFAVVRVDFFLVVALCTSCLALPCATAAESKRKSALLCVRCFLSFAIT